MVVVKKIGMLFLLLIAMLQLSSCGSSQEADKKPQQVVQVVKKQPTVTLFFRGVIQPIKIFSVVSPFEGRLTALHFQYGDTLKDGEIIAAISSEKLSDDFKKVVTDYLSKKSAFFNSKEEFTGTKMLYNAGVSSKSDFMSSKSTYQNDALSFMQAKFELETLLRKLNMDPEEIEKLSLADQEQLAPLLTRQFKHIDIPASGSGVALFPLKSQDVKSNDDVSGELHVGTKLNQGQLMLSIGDMSGLSVDVTASEESINQLKVGMPAVVTSDAFPGVNLQGKIASVSLQADPNNSGGRSLSQFPLQVVVPTVDKAAMSLVKVGMTCKVRLDLKSPAAMMLPIAAVKFDGSTATVKQLTDDGHSKIVKVMTGITTASEVVIISGLKVGDRVLMDD